MLFNKLRKRAQEEKGFTLIELLVVILIIGILAAIAIPSFLGQRDKANDSKAKANARTVQTALESYYTDTQDYSAATKAIVKAIEPTLSAVPDADITFTVAAQNYEVGVASSTGTNFTITRAAGGGVTRGCDSPGEGGCKVALDAAGNRW